MNSPQVDALAIIESVKNHPCLYDRRVKVSIRDKANKWDELGKLYGIPGHQMRTRWTSIKDKYILFKRRAEAYPGTTLGKQIETFKYASNLTFLDDTIPPYIGDPPKNKIQKYVAMSKHWEKSHTVLLIKLLSHHPLLWDKSHPYYHHHLQRMAAYRGIAEVIKRYNSTVTPEMILKKIKSIRVQFNKEKRDQKRKNIKPGAPYTPKLWFYNKLKFLDEKRTYDSTNLNGNATDQLAEKTLESFSAENYIENDHDFDGNDNDQDKHVDNVDEDEDDDEYNDTEEWISTNDSTRPFEQVQLCYDDEENEEREGFVGEIEEVFDQKDNIKRITVNPSQTRSDLYAKCTGLLESLAKQIKPYEVGEKKQTNCKNCSPSSLLGKMIESELADVSEHIFLDAKWKIIRILEEAQRKSLQDKQDQMI